MAKRFEGISTPSFVDLVTAYQLLRIDNLLGVEGKNTAFAMGGHTGDNIVFHVVPGDWTEDELADLIDIAVSGIAPATTYAQAA